MFMQQICNKNQNYPVSRDFQKPKPTSSVDFNFFSWNKHYASFYKLTQMYHEMIGPIKAYESFT